MSNDLVESNYEQVVLDLLARVKRLEGGSVVAQELSEISSDMGLIEGGELRIHSDWADPKEPGDGFSGVRILGSFEYPEGSGTYYAIVGVNNDSLTFGLSSVDGSAIFCSGNATIDQDGISGTDLLKWMIKQTATNSTYTRTGKLGMELAEGGSIPNWELSYASDEAVELVNNGDFEDGDFTGWTKTTETNGAWEIDDVVFHGGAYSVKWAPTADGDGNSKSLLHFDGVDASTTFTDVSGKTWTAHGNAQIDTAQKVFGTGSGLFDGTGDYIDTPDHDDFNVGSGNFTIDFYFRANSALQTKELFAQCASTGANSTISFDIYLVDDGQIVGLVCSGSSAYRCESATGVYAADTWYHLAMVRNGNILTLYLDGSEIASTAVTGVTVNNSSYKPTIGRLGEYNGLYFNGWIDEFRFTKGAARWTADFTPPAAAYEDIKTEGVLTSDRTATTENTSYQVSTRIKIAALSGTVKAEVKWYDDPAAGSLLQTDVIGTIIGASTFGLFDKTITSPAGADSCEIILTCSSSTVYDVNFDDVSVVAVTVNQKLQITDDGLATTNGMFPQSVILFPSMIESSTNAVTLYVATAQMWCLYGAIAAASAANGDIYTYSFMAEKGTYSMLYYYLKSSAGGKADIYIDDVKVVSLLDHYAASATYDQKSTTTSIAITYSGRHELKLVVNGKHASSSDYSLYHTAISLWRTGA